MSYQDYSQRELKILKFIKRHPKCSGEKITHHFGNSALSTINHMREKGLISKYEPFGITLRGNETLEDFKLHKRSIICSRLTDAGIALIGVVVGYLLSLIGSILELK